MRLEFAGAETQAILGSWGRNVVMVEVMTLVMGEVTDSGDRRGGDDNVCNYDNGSED